MPRSQRVVAVVVTYDRRELLVESLTALERQTRRPDEVIVVDNASTDGTAETVRELFGSVDLVTLSRATDEDDARRQSAALPVDLVTLSRNTGGAGGFAVGVARALERGAELVWLMDDDTVPEPAALAALLDARDRYRGDGRPALIASRVVWTDGRLHPMNTPREKPRVSRAERFAAAAVGCTPIRSASFVSVLVDGDAARERGLPIADYFLWNDDFEYTTRLLRDARGVLCPASVVIHKTPAPSATDADPGERFFYEVRNKVWTFTRSSGLGHVERVLYLGSTIRRWGRTVARSHHRALLFRELRRGFAAGIRAGPRPTENMLADPGMGDASLPTPPAGGRA